MRTSWLCLTLLLAHDLGEGLEEAFARKMLQDERKYPVEASRGRAYTYDDIWRRTV